MDELNSHWIQVFPLFEIVFLPSVAVVYLNGRVLISKRQNDSIKCQNTFRMIVIDNWLNIEQRERESSKKDEERQIK